MQPQPSFKDQTVLVTGANRGLGLEFCRQLHAAGAHVVGWCRQSDQELESMGIEVRTEVEVTENASIAAAVAAFASAAAGHSPRRLDLLINNAGVLAREDLDHLDLESIRSQFEINAIGPLAVTASLLPHLQRDSKVGIVTSRMGSIADNTSGSRYGYRMSKAAVNIAGVSLARDLEPRGVSVALLHPGYVRTRMTGFSGLIEADEAVEGMLARLNSLCLATTGRFWHSNGEELPW